MRKQLDRIVVVDVESTEQTPEQPSEIFQVGVCTLDTGTLERADKGSLLVLPARSTITPFIEGLTGFVQADIEGAQPLAVACRTLRDDYLSRARVWASYGDYDRTQFDRNCTDLGLPSPFGKRHINVKTLAALVLCTRKEFGMAGTLAHLGLPLDGRHHDGADDAWNIAAILAELLRRSRR